ncbi:MAG: metallophosphoesterase [Clostridia bacterium]|nr:metallophosphoesterase [Clostridia bacterium]
MNRLNRLNRVMLLLMVCAFAMICGAEAEEKAAYTDIVILSTTDLHGKCWDTNVLTGSAEKNNLLRISTAVNEIREKYGKEQVLLIDNGDLYQGTQVSEYQLMQRHLDQSDAPLAMALCLKEIGYTASVLGNHEFNYPWEVMEENYRWLEESGVPVLAANICQDGTETGTNAGDSAFTPYIIRQIMVNGHAHKIGILGLENCDIPPVGHAG